MVYNKHSIYSVILCTLWSQATSDPVSLEELTINLNIQDKASPGEEPNPDAKYGHYVHYKDYFKFEGSEGDGTDYDGSSGDGAGYLTDCKCGVKKGSAHGLELGSASQPRIAHGEPTEPNEYPWHVGIQMKTGTDVRTICGASLISTETVLTAAHCAKGAIFAESELKPGNPDLFGIIAGAHNIEKPESGVIKVGVKAILFHPEVRYYSEEMEPFLSKPKYDCAILHLSEPIKWTDKVQPICLPEGNKILSENVEVILSGWGLNEKDQRTTDVLQDGTLKIINNPICDVPEQICARSTKLSACNGDSGGPLVTKGPGNSYSQVGIVSRGVRCSQTGGKNTISVYCSVSHIMPWIKANMKGTSCPPS